MSRKHNTKHPSRGRSLYPRRLQDRGFTSKSVRMPTLETLRGRQHADTFDMHEFLREYR